MERKAVIECDQELLLDIAMTLQGALVGKPVMYGDKLHDLIKRHCPELYDQVKDEGFILIPSDNKDDLKKVPPQIWFDVIRITEPN